MNFSEFFKAFYIGGNDGCLKGYTTTYAIPMFFAETTLGGSASAANLPTDVTSYDKWFQGTSSPRNHWAAFQAQYNESEFINKVAEVLNKANETALLHNFHIELAEGETFSPNQISRAIARQWKAIIDGKGEAENIFADVFYTGVVKAEFTAYTEKASQRYNVMKLIGGTEVPLKDFFVCNTIGERERVFAAKNRSRVNYLEDASLASIRSFYEKRGYDNLKTVLIGSGGCGKSLMLQHLFLKAVEEYNTTGILPVFLELRHFTQKDDLFSFIVRTVHDKDEKFTAEAAHRYLISGRCQLLLDGFDEIDPSDINTFLTKLEQFTDKYTQIQIVITSRQNESLTGLYRYKKLYVWPFDEDQSLQLIDKILTYQHKMGKKENVLNYITNGFLQKDGVFVSHPLLLTYVAMNFREFPRFSDDHLLFYKNTYEALLSGHDDNKKPYDRVFMSVDNASQFTDVFRQFCAYTYRDGKLKLNSSEFEAYFKMLTAQNRFENPKKMNVKNFRHDVCSTACIMYEKEYDLYYIDPGFQEFLFAEYYSMAESAEVEALRKSLCRLSYQVFLRFDALDMLYKFAELKFKKWILKPFLDSIFIGSNEESFAAFLQKCFDEISIINVDAAAEAAVFEAYKPKEFVYPAVENFPKTILLDYIFLDILQMPVNAFSLNAFFDEGIFEDAEMTGILVGSMKHINVNEREVPFIIVESKPTDTFEYLNKNHPQKYSDEYIVDDSGNLVRFGTRQTFDTYDLAEEPDKYASLIADIILHSSRTFEAFLELKKYYSKLKKEIHKSGI